jgi:hypothetical protein
VGIAEKGITMKQDISQSLRGSRDILRESARQLRLKDCQAHAAHCDHMADQVDSCLTNNNGQNYNLLQTWDAYTRCCVSDNADWVDKHWDRITRTLLDALPHGSGIDYDWQFYAHGKKHQDLACSNGYHWMNEHGMYCGTIDFQVIIKHGVRDMFGNLIFKIAGQFGKHQDIKDYLYEIIHDALKNL